MTAPSTSTAPPTPGDPFVSGSLPCIRCTYNLDTCPVASVCPECGAPASLSLESLWLEDPAFLRRLRRGATILSIAALVGPALGLLTMLGLFLMRDTANQRDLLPWVSLAMVAGPILAWRGMGDLARPRPDRAMWSARLLLGIRVLAIAFAVVFGAFMVLYFLEFSGWARPDEVLAMSVAIAAGELWCLRNILALAHLRALAQVSNMPWLAWVAPIFQCWNAFLAVGGLVLAAVLWLKVHPPPFVLNSGIMTLGAAMVTWIFTWPLVLGRFGRALKTMIKHIESNGPRIVDSTALPDKPSCPDAREPPARLDA